MPLLDTNIPNDPAQAESNSPAAGGKKIPPTSPLGQVAQKADPSAPVAPEDDYSAMVKKQYGELETARSEKQTILDDAVQKLLARQKGPSEAEMYFRLAGALGAPTKTGGFGETLARTAEVGGDILKQRREAQDALEDLQMKYKLQGADVRGDAAKEKIGAAKTLKELNDPNSAYGKQAQDEGLKPGTPAFASRVRQLSLVDQNLKNAQAKSALITASSKEVKPLNPTQQKQVNTHLDVTTTAERNVTELERLKGVVKEAGWWQTGLVGQATAWTGFGKAAEIENQISALAPKQRPPGAGATSDYDAKQYKKAVGGGLTKDSLDRTLNAGIAMHQNDAQYNAFMASVIEARGSQAEARKTWSEYAKQNPIFDSKGLAIPNRTGFEAWINGAPPAVVGNPKGGKNKGGKPQEAPATPATPAKPTAKDNKKSAGVTKTVGNTTYYQHADGSWHDEPEE